MANPLQINYTMNPNDSAFPQQLATKNDELYHQPDHYSGLTVRAYIAAKALQGILANPRTINNLETVSSASVEYTDALIAELNKPLDR